MEKKTTTVVVPITIYVGRAIRHEEDESAIDCAVNHITASPLAFNKGVGIPEGCFIVDVREPDWDNAEIQP